jgi:hypothetical protein
VPGKILSADTTYVNVIDPQGVKKTITPTASGKSPILQVKCRNDFCFFWNKGIMAQSAWRD